jgi:demethylmenaquinone methyltransferase/2-methoxy-6-polyprenyl-1,4-benzoquinol methylase
VTGSVLHLISQARSAYQPCRYFGTREAQRITNEHRETNRTFYDRISRAYDFIADSGKHKAREAGGRLLRLISGECVLEIGFVTGNSIVNLATSVSPTGKVCGADVSPGMLAVAGSVVAEGGGQ